MILGKKELFTQEHFESVQGLSESYLAELVVYCLELVSQLAASGLKFRFKGGNSLLLLLQDPQRFSIDVDIATNEDRDKVTEIAEKIAGECELFTHLEVRKPRTKPWLPMISFKFFFDSFYQKPEDAFVMLDVILKAPPYPGILKPVECLDIYRSDQQAEVPTISGIIGDKLLTIGPATLGIPLGKGKEAQRLKHIFDIALLSRQRYKIEEVKESISSCIAQENQLQQKNFSLPEVLEDTRDFCIQPLAYPEKPELEAAIPSIYLYEILNGFEEFCHHLFGREYGWESFREDCEAVLNLIEKLREQP